MKITFDAWYRENRLKEGYIQMSQEELIKAYDEETTWVYGLKSAIDIKILTYLLKLADINGNIHFTPTCRKRLAKLLSISMQQITNSLRNLKDKELIEGERQRYHILL